MIFILLEDLLPPNTYFIEWEFQQELVGIRQAVFSYIVTEKESMHYQGCDLRYSPKQ